MLISLLKAILRDWQLKDLTLHITEIGKIIEKFYKASSAFENKLVTYKVTASSAFENVKVFGWLFTKSQWGVWEQIIMRSLRINNLW